MTVIGDTDVLRDSVILAVTLMVIVASCISADTGNMMVRVIITVWFSLIRSAVLILNSALRIMIVVRVAVGLRGSGRCVNPVVVGIYLHF